RQRVRPRHGRCGARTRYRRARFPDPGHRHGDGRSSRSCPARPVRPRLRGFAVTRTRIAAIIPVSTLDGAKTRLGEALDAEERRDLVDSFLARTVVAALAVDRLDDVLVVSPDREMLRRAAE